MSEQENGNKRPALYLCAPVNALVEGIYNESIPFAEVKKHGDFGLGTFDHLDGEMIMLDGLIYQITADGHVALVPESSLTPFACVTFFRSHSEDTINTAQTWAEFTHWFNELLPSRNIFYALRIDGVFSHMKVRSVPKQESYRPLVEVARDQPVFEFNEIEGTLAGFFTPSFMSSISVPGLHLHFLSKDLQHGGHLLEFAPRFAKVNLQFINQLTLGLPMTLDYLTWDFRREISREIKKVER